MKVVRELPPNIDQINSRFPGVKDNHSILFTYGDTIFTLSEKPIPLELMKHEMVHSQRQSELGVELWWDNYVKDPKFVLEEELLAHQVEYEVFCQTKGKDRNTRRLYLTNIAKRLSSPMYGSCCSLKDAKKWIKDRHESS